MPATLPRVLFILKRREDYTHHPSYSQNGMSTGLLNSATFMHDMLHKNGIESKVVVVVDNNCIDREVSLFKPTHVIIEAVWVVPSKFEVLAKLHPTVKWIVRYHSDAPFISGEGIAMQWTAEYLKTPNVILGINAIRFLKEVRMLGEILSVNNVQNRVIHLPNYYPDEKIRMPKGVCTGTVKIGCFGAVRPLKNQFIQALAAIKFASEHRLRLEFHINGNRVEGKGDNALKNIRAVFNSLGDDYQLVEHDWMPHDQLKTLMSTMDIGMQVSFSETFNIVAADFITVGVPVVGSSEIPWLRTGEAVPTSSDDIARKLSSAYAFRCYNVVRNTMSLRAYARASEQEWLTYLLLEK